MGRVCIHYYDRTEKWVVYVYVYTITIGQRSGSCMYTLLRCVTQYACNRGEGSCWPSLYHCRPPSLDPVCSSLYSNVTTVCLQDTRFYTIFYETCNAWYMLHGPWVNLNPLFSYPVKTSPHPPCDWGKWIYSVANQNPRMMPHALSK